MPPQCSQSSSAARTQGQKSRLFCPTCGHESPVDGDWHVRAHADGVVYGCPVCGDTLTVRPTSGRRNLSVSSEAPAGDFLARSVRLALAWTAWPCTPEECALP